jgi:membrane dipeptidase
MTANSRKASELHRTALVIDTHADTPQRFLDEGFDLADPLAGGHVNLDAIRRGNLGAEFFSIWVEPDTYQGRWARRTLELIDSVRRQVAQHPGEMDLALSSEAIEQAHRNHRFAVLLGLEGGHSIENSLALLRQYFALGVRYMTLTWSNSNDWADSSGDIDDPNVPHTPDGLTTFGAEVVHEMNDLGMMVDVSHVADRTFYRTLATSRAPVFASHSGARALCDHPRNMTDDMIRGVAQSGGSGSGGGVVCVNFFSGFVSQAYRDALAALKPEVDAAVASARGAAGSAGREFTYGDQDRIRRRYMDGVPRPPLSDLLDQIDHIAKVAGADHVGLGSDFDGVAGQLPTGLDSAADLPEITGGLLDRGYAAEDVRKILGLNVLRLFREVAVASKQGQAAGSHGAARRSPSTTG